VNVLASITARAGQRLKREENSVPVKYVRSKPAAELWITGEQKMSVHSCGFSVQVYFSDFGNHQPGHLIGQVRRLADEFGRPGIIGKRGQKNARVLKKGYLRIVWPTRKLARAFQRLVGEFWGHLVSTRRFRLA
jgi:hypothetical protein